MVKAKETEIKLRELEKLLAQKKISAKEYLDLKAQLELEAQGKKSADKKQVAGLKIEKAAEAAKQATKPKLLNFICPNCGSPQRNVPSGVEEFNCEMCGKRIKVFDATKEAERLLAKMPAMMEAVAFEQLFIQPEKFMLEKGLQREIAYNHLQEKMDSMMFSPDPLNTCFGQLFDAHGFKFLQLPSDSTQPVVVPWAKLKDESHALVIVPFDKEKKFDPDFAVLSFGSQFGVFDKLGIRDDLGVSDLIKGLQKGVQKVLSQEKIKAALTSAFPWNNVKSLAGQAEKCFVAVKPFNEIANNFALLGAYAPQNLKLYYFLSIQMGKSKFEREIESTDVDEENAEHAEEGKKVFGEFSPLCWANFYKGLASHFQGYGQLLLIKKEGMEKSLALGEQGKAEAIRNFEDASEAFERAVENSDIKRQYYLKFYAHLSKAFAKALKKELGKDEISGLEQERDSLANVEEKIFEPNEGSAWAYMEQGYFAGDVYRKYFESTGGLWKNQRIKGLARTIEGPRFLFFLELLFAKELASGS